MITYKEALQESLKYFNDDELAAQVFLKKYALQTPDGVFMEKTPDDMHRRLAKEFARIEAKYINPLDEEKIYEYLKNFKYLIPQGSPMAGIGNPYQTTSISNCFVVPAPLDAYGSILRTDEMLAQISKRRGGVGVDISNLRPNGSSTKNSAKTSTGIGPFMERFSNTIREVGQNNRRGALMITISIHHPEIETFIKIKQDRKKVTGANISIRLTDEFMSAVKNNDQFELRFPVDDVVNPKIRKKISARKIWEQIIHSAWDSGEPGVLFWDNILKGPADCYEKFRSVSTNPCSEIPLSELDSCRLLAINLFSFVDNPFTNKAKFDFDHFSVVVQDAQRIMDDIIDLEIESVRKILDKIKSDPEPFEHKRTETELWEKIIKACEDGRRTGLGITALGDALAALGIRYGSDESIEISEKIYKYLALNSYRATVSLAEERGAFPDYDYNVEKHNKHIQNIMCLDKDLEDRWKKFGRRNVSLTTIAPTGTVSTLTQTTSGVEPVFEISYTRRRKINPEDQTSKVDFVDDLGDKWQEYKVYHSGFKKWMEITGKNKIDESPYWGSRANDIDWLSSVKLQASMQKWCDHAISKTCNLPTNTPESLVSEIYMNAWESGCKGFTIYRDGSRSGVLVTDDSKNQNVEKILENHAPKRPEILECDIYHAQVRGEKWNFFVGLIDDRPYEIFAGRSKHIHLPKSKKRGIIKKNGTYNLYTGEGDNEFIIEDLATVFENPTESAFTRTVSLALRHGVPIQFIVEQIEKGADKENDMFSLAKGLMRTLKKYIKDGTKPSTKKCPECYGEKLAYQEGCLTCKTCGWSKCS